MGGIKIPQDYFYRRMLTWRNVSIIAILCLFVSFGIIGYLLMGVICE